MISLSCYKINGFLFYCYYVLCFFLDFWVGSFSLFSVSVVETKLIWLWHNGIRLITCSINFGWVTHEAYLCVYCLIYSFAEYFFLFGVGCQEKWFYGDILVFLWMCDWKIYSDWIFWVCEHALKTLSLL